MIKAEMSHELLRQYRGYLSQANGTVVRSFFEGTQTNKNGKPVVAFILRERVPSVSPCPSANTKQNRPCCSASSR
jgi:hypothetical protein